MYISNIPAPKRIRVPDYPQWVTALPCLICQRRPSDAHHLKRNIPANPATSGSYPTAVYITTHSTMPEMKNCGGKIKKYKYGRSPCWMLLNKSTYKIAS